MCVWGGEGGGRGGCFYFCESLHNGRFGYKVVNTHQLCDCISSWGDLSWLSTIIMLKNIECVVSLLSPWVLRKSPQKNVDGSFFYWDECVVNKGFKSVACGTSKAHLDCKDDSYIFLLVNLACSDLIKYIKVKVLCS